MTISETSPNSVLPNSSKLRSENARLSLNEAKIHNSDETFNEPFMKSLPVYLKDLFSSNNSPHNNNYKWGCLFPHGCKNNVRMKSLNSERDQQPSTIYNGDEDMEKRSEREVRCISKR